MVPQTVSVQRACNVPSNLQACYVSTEAQIQGYAMKKISFGDNVRVRSTPLTEKLGLASLIGPVFGLTVPSSSGVGGIIGGTEKDFAINVMFDERNEAFWFAEDLLELIDHGAGTQIKLKGVSKKWTRSESGEWIEGDSD
jgi:hypothetical protein